ncbi:CGL30 [Auxenochlorella protothecoides x Auxenochlorella symbiontica]
MLSISGRMKTADAPAMASRAVVWRRALHVCCAHPGPLDRNRPATPAPMSEGLRMDRRRVMTSLGLSTGLLTGLPNDAGAVQGSTAGRLPGAGEPDDEGFLHYTRPEGKSGGHGVGWSEMPRYSLVIPSGWEEQPVSIADLGGTEIDMRYSSPEEGALSVVVAPILRFLDVGFNANVTLSDIGSPEKVLTGFAPEITGSPISEEDVIRAATETKDGIPYYQWDVKPHVLVSATAVGNRVFLLTITANGRQWRRAAPRLRRMQQSFYVPPLAA